MIDFQPEQDAAACQREDCMSTSPILGSHPDLIKALKAAGMPPLCKRIVIDISANGPVRIFFEVVGSKSVIDVVLAAGLSVTEQPGDPA